MLRPVSSPLHVPGLAETDAALDDLLVLHDVSAAGLRRVALERLLGFALAGVCQGRLTLTSGTPIPTSDVVTASTIYFQPFRGRWTALFDGTRWKLHDLTAGVAKTLSGLTSNRPHDVFLFDDAGTLTLAFAAWTNDATRATALATQDGVLVQSGNPTRRYLGSFFTTSAATTEDSARNRYLVNANNAVPRQLFTCPAYNNNNANTSYTHTSTTFAEWNGGTHARVNWLVPVDGGYAEVLLHGFGDSPASAVLVFGMGWDSATTARIACQGGNVGATRVEVGGRFGECQAAGRHFAAGLALVGSGTATIYADLARFGGTTDPYATFLHGWIMG
jgi:hypothetical protein